MISHLIHLSSCLWFVEPNNDNPLGGPVGGGGGGEMQPGGEEIQLQDPLYVFTSFVTFLIFLMLM